MGIEYQIQIFNDWADDEADFHSWCMRKFTLRAYVGCLAYLLALSITDLRARMIRWEDKVRRHPAFYRAAIGAVEVRTGL